MYLKPGEQLMKSKLTIQELSIVIVAKNHNPSILNPDFLKDNNIVPKVWNLASAPICVEPYAQVEFQTRVTIKAQSDKLVFSEQIREKDKSQIAIPEIAIGYSKLLEYVNYTAVGINPSGYLFLGENSTPSSFIRSTFLKDDAWLHFGENAPRAGVRLAFPLEEYTLNIFIDEGTTQSPGQPPRDVLIINGNFHYEIRGEKREERLRDLHTKIKSWESLLVKYEDFVNIILKED
jgi:hypothetical protein